LHTTPTQNKYNWIRELLQQDPSVFKAGTWRQGYEELMEPQLRQIQLASNEYVLTKQQQQQAPEHLKQRYDKRLHVIKERLCDLAEVYESLYHFIEDIIGSLYVEYKAVAVAKNREIAEWQQLHDSMYELAVKQTEKLLGKS
jgi:hypothetical protein